MNTSDFLSKDNMPNKYYIIAYGALLLLFAISLFQGSFHVFIIMQMIIIFGAALLLNTIDV